MEAALFFLALILVAGGVAEWGAWFSIPAIVVGVICLIWWLALVVKREREKDIHGVGEAINGGYAERNHLNYIPKPYNPHEYDH